MKNIAILMIMVSCIGVGIVLQMQEQKKLRKLQLLLVMLSDIKTKMKCTLLSTKDIFLSLSENPQYSLLEFLNECCDSLKNGFDFPESFGNAVLKKDYDIPKKFKDMLISLGNYLGTTDLQGQLSYIDLITSYIEKECEELSEKHLKKGNMYLSLGFLAGIAIAVVLY